jgi:hypothetical protein
MKTLTLAICALIALNPIYAGTITAIKDGNWSAKGTWDLHREPGDNDVVVIPSSRTVALKNTPYSKTNISARPQLTINIYGTLDFSDKGIDKLYLADGSKIQIYEDGRISTSSGSDEIIAIRHGSSDNTIWDGNPITVNGAAYAISTSGGFINAVLPLKFISFNAEKTNQGSVSLNWTTAEERNTGYFDVEWYDGNSKDWSAVGQVRAAGNSDALRNYNYVFNQPADGPNQFRLKQVDIDGRFTYSEIRTVIWQNNSGAGIRYDSRSRTVYFTDSKTEELKLQLFDMGGVLRYKQKVNNVRSLTLPSVVPGVYLLRVNDPQGRVNTRRIVIR